TAGMRAQATQCARLNATLVIRRGLYLSVPGRPAWNRYASIPVLSLAQPTPASAETAAESSRRRVSARSSARDLDVVAWADRRQRSAHAQLARGRGEPPKLGAARARRAGMVQCPMTFPNAYSACPPGLGNVIAGMLPIPPTMPWYTNTTPTSIGGPG